MSRLERIRSVLNRRQPDLTALLDRVHKSHNLAAVIRTCDAVGIGEVHYAPPPEGYSPSRHIAQGTQKWVRVRRHEDFQAACSHLRAGGFQLVAAHPSDHALDFREIDYTVPMCIVFGQEKLGLGANELDHMDLHAAIPMLGMAASLNVSVAAAVILYEAQRQRTAAGLYGKPRLHESDYQRELVRGLHPSIARYCERYCIPYPALDGAGDPLPGWRAQR